MEKRITGADQIRLWVAENFNDIGEFRTNDVVNNIKGVEIRDTANISAALVAWVEGKRIVNGLRMRRKTEKGKTAVWEIFPSKSNDEVATGNGVKKAPAIEGGTFIGTIVDQRKSVSGAFLVMSDGKVYKVELLKY